MVQSQTDSQVREFSRSQGTGSQVIDEPLPVVHTNSSLPTISAQQMIDEFSAQIDAAELALAEQASAAEVVEEPTPVSGAPDTGGDSNGHFVVPKTTSQDPSQDWEELGGDLNQEGDGFESAGSGRDGNGQGTARGSEQSAPLAEPSAGTQAANSSQLLRIDLNQEGDGFESAGSGRDGNGQGTARGSEQSAPLAEPSAGTQAANSSQLLRIDLNQEGDGFGYAGSGRDGKADKNLTTSDSRRPRHRRARPRRTRR